MDELKGVRFNNQSYKFKTQLSEMTDDATHRLVTDEEKSEWNAKVTTKQLNQAITDSIINVLNTEV